MAKIKLTKGELKRQRDALAQYQRYLPTLQLKKQQLQLEILQQDNLLIDRERSLAKKKEQAGIWAGLLSGPIDLGPWIKPVRIVSSIKNVAGVDISIFEKVEFDVAEYDLFVVPLWVDFAIEALHTLVSLKNEIMLIKEGINVLRQELRITTQRVNLFEKVKIPETEEAIRLIKVYIGDQMANAVGRSKIAKRKIEEVAFAGAAV
ncbi:MAG: V-type ATP synthase subunit D [Candidatus Omnitrophica bacterium]|nr:V-type ATP synthase subunit D [Candidatus Omnitrophota bacterium]